MAHSLTRKEKQFAAFVLIVVAVTLGAIVYVVRRHSGAQGGKVEEATISFLYGLLAALVIALIAFAFRPFQSWLQEYLHTPDHRASEVRMLLFGQTGSGKTSFAMYTLTTKPLEFIDSSPAFVRRTGPVTLSPGRELTVMLGDYRGEEPSQATVDLPISFAGAEGNRLIDAIVFFVDLIGREYDPDQPGQLFDDDRLIQWLLDDPEDRFARRVTQHKFYLSAAVLEILFSVVYGPRLRNVFFVITKADLLRKATAAGALPRLANGDLEDNAVALFSDVIARINAACTKNDIPSCSVDVISLRDESARKFVFEVLGMIVQDRGGSHG